MRLVIVVLLCAASAMAQSAKVIQLAPEDAAKAKRLWQATKDAQAEMDAFTEHVRAAYLSAKKDAESNCISGYVAFNPPLKPPLRYVQGWGCGEFEYSEDFKFIVPVHVEPVQNHWITMAPAMVAQ